MDNTTFQAIPSAMDGTFEGGMTVGILENGVMHWPISMTYLSGFA